MQQFVQIWGGFGLCAWQELWGGSLTYIGGDSKEDFFVNDCKLSKSGVVAIVLKDT